mmetsp:Transcript_140306/g.391171  ORF Transcript_140306/g.391171 Transcript_140306/m.391171 type:complete len:216 (-) Transcript_140306:142-789(-)
MLIPVPVSTGKRPSALAPGLDATTLGRTTELKTSPRVSARPPSRPSICSSLQASCWWQSSTREWHFRSWFCSSMMSIVLIPSHICKMPLSNSAMSIVPEPSASTASNSACRVWGVKLRSVPESRSRTCSEWSQSSSRVTMPSPFASMTLKTFRQSCWNVRRLCSRSTRSSSALALFFSNMLSLITPVSKAIIPKLPNMMKPTRKGKIEGWFTITS